MGDYRFDRERVDDFGLAQDDAAPIGSLDRRHATSARRVSRTEDGQWVFGCEEELVVQVQWRALTASSDRGMWRLEAKVAVDVEPRTRPAAGDVLIVVEYPRSNGWVSAAKFKGANSHSGHVRVQLPETLGESSSANRMGRDVDPWEKGDWLSASPDCGPDPDLLLADVEVSGPDANLLLHTPPRNLTKNAQWIFGVCSDFARARRELFEQPRAKKLLADAEAGTMSSVVPKGRRGVRESRAVHERAAEEARWVMQIAIAQALAGPSSHDQLPKDRREWDNALVMVLVERIYRNHLDDKTRVFKRASSREREFDDD